MALLTATRRRAIAPDSTRRRCSRLSLGARRRPPAGAVHETAMNEDHSSRCHDEPPFCGKWDGTRGETKVTRATSRRTSMFLDLSAAKRLYEVRLPSTGESAEAHRGASGQGARRPSSSGSRSSGTDRSDRRAARLLAGRRIDVPGEGISLAGRRGRQSPDVARRSWNIRYISAVQRPMPRTTVRRPLISPGRFVSYCASGDGAVEYLAERSRARRACSRTSCSPEGRRRRSRSASPASACRRRARTRP
jgi:hypothetical protein